MAGLMSGMVKTDLVSLQVHILSRMVKTDLVSLQIQLGKRIVMLQAGTGNLFCGLIVACNDRCVMVKVTDKEGIDYGMQRVRIDRANPEVSIFAI
ncbi:unnamed protein product [Toxocara canis]|uniref:Flagellar biosynthesis protein FlgA n=1 Tax=Toxocara canis TaxID=6265 RepID=A0A183V787_TOXCA|nr:unnamed protein product [Toxocara canis]